MRCVGVSRNDFSARRLTRFRFGSRRAPIGSTGTVSDGICWPPPTETVRAYGVPLRCSKLADIWTSNGRRYAPETRPSHSHVWFAEKISAFGSSAGRFTVNAPAVVGTNGMFSFVAE